MGSYVLIILFFQLTYNIVNATSVYYALQNTYLNRVRELQW